MQLSVSDRVTATRSVRGCRREREIEAERLMGAEQRRMQLQEVAAIVSAPPDDHV